MFKNMKSPAKNSSVPAKDEEVVEIDPQKDAPFINGDPVNTARFKPSDLPMEPVRPVQPRSPMKNMK